MRAARPRLTGTSAVVLGAFAVVVPLVSGVSVSAASGVSGVPADPAAGAGGAVSSVSLVPAGAGATAAPMAGRPVTPHVRDVQVPDVSRRGEPHLAAVSTPAQVNGFGLVGASWKGGEPRNLELKVRTKDGGSWSQWQVLPVNDDHGPNPGSAEARAATREGSDPMVVGNVDQVQVRATSTSGEAPRDLELNVVNPGKSPADADPGVPALTGTATGVVPTASTLPASPEPPLATTQSAVLSGAVSSRVSAAAVIRAHRPRIFTRRQWGANERLRSRAPHYSHQKFRGAFVHHTVNTNGYTRRQVPGIIRAIYAFHTQVNGWSDIGYNFLVDRFGRIWEGRFGGVTRHVIGAHTLNFNEEAFAMSAIGCYDTRATCGFKGAKPSHRMLAAYGRLFAWKLGLDGIRAGSRQRLNGRIRPAIEGHRDVGQTACPGRFLYDRIGSIRHAAIRAQHGLTPFPSAGQTPTPTTPTTPPPTTTPKPTPTVRAASDRLRDLQADGFPDLVVRNAVTQQLQLLIGDGGPGFAARRAAVDSVGDIGQFSGVGDVTGDGRPDLLVRNARSKITRVRPGRADGTFRAAVASTDRFAGADLVTGVGNMIGNRRPDLVARSAKTGTVWLYPGRAGSTWGRKHLLLRRAGHLGLLSGAGDLNRDGHRDLLARSGGKLLLYPGTAKGHVSAARVIARHWGGKDLAVAGADVTGDGAPDVVARDRASGRTWIYLTRSNGSIVRRFGGWTGWKGLQRLTGVGDVTGDGNADLVARSGDRLVVLPSRGTRWLQGPLSTGRLAGDADFAQVVGDWDGDSLPDVVARSGARGTVWLYRGTGTQSLQRRVALFPGWKERTFLVGPGDMTGDGRADLISRGSDGRVWLHASSGVGKPKPQTLARQHLFNTDLVAAAGRWNGDSVPDLVVRRLGSKDLYLVPGKAGGTLGAPVLLRGGRNFAAYDRIIGVGDLNGDRRPDLVAREKGKGRLWLFEGSASGLHRRQFLASGLTRYDLIG